MSSLSLHSCKRGNLRYSLVVVAGLQATRFARSGAAGAAKTQRGAEKRFFPQSVDKCDGMFFLAFSRCAAAPLREILHTLEFRMVKALARPYWIDFKLGEWR